jgi:hypothetical protein
VAVVIFVQSHVCSEIVADHWWGLCRHKDDARENTKKQGGLHF